MPEASRRSRTKNPRKWVKRFIYILIIVTLFAWSYSPIKTRTVQRRQVERLNDQLILEKKENKRLRVELELLKGDDEYIEDIAREKLGMIKAEEEGYIVIEEGDGSDGSLEEEGFRESNSDKESWWHRMLSIFKIR